MPVLGDAVDVTVELGKKVVEHQLQEAENWNKPAATTWAAEFLLREGESRECLVLD